jgi:hypothetical protein
VNEPLKKTDPELIKALAKEAGELMGNLAFRQAILDLRKQWFAEMMGEGLDDLRVRDLRAKLMALEAIPQMLQHFMSSQTMAQKGSQRA